jgi:putative MATE family efflux protein
MLSDKIQHTDVGTDVNSPLCAAAAPAPYGRCLRRLAPLIGTNAASVALWYAALFVPIAIVGHERGPHDMGALSVGVFALSMLCMYPSMGLCFAVDTLCSQIFGADPDSAEQGAVAQRSLVVVAAFVAPMSLLLQLSDWPLGLVYDADMARRAYPFLRWAPFYLAGMLPGFVLSKFLNNQLKPLLATIGLGVAAAVTAAVTFALLRFVPSLALGAVAIGMGCGSWAQVAVLVALIARDDGARRRWGPRLPLRVLLDRGAVRQHLALALPSALFVVVEASSFDVTVLFAGLLGAHVAAAWSAVLTVMLVFQSVAAGCSLAATALVGQAVGDGRPGDARRLAATAVAVAVACAAVCAAASVAFPGVVFGVMSSDATVQRLIAAMLWMLPAFHVLDCAQFTFQGIFSGCARNAAGAAALVASLWCVGVPLSYYLGVHRGYGVGGVCGGLTVGLALEVPMLAGLALCRFTWRPVVDIDHTA